MYFFIRYLQITIILLINRLLFNIHYKCYFLYLFGSLWYYDNIIINHNIVIIINNCHIIINNNCTIVNSVV